MAELKTKANSGDVGEFLSKVENKKKQEDSFLLLDIFSQVTGYKPVMWGDSIIGYGSYHYKSQRSTQEGDWMLTGFSPRKQNISIYIMPGFSNYTDLLDKLGKHKISKGSCLYINRLSDININVLKKLIKNGVEDMKKNYKINE